MTRKDYELIARALKRAAAEAQAEGHDLDALRTGAIELAYSLADDNPRFDRERFMKACGL